LYTGSEVPKPKKRNEYNLLVKKSHAIRKYHGVMTPIKVMSHSATLGGRVIINERITNAVNAKEGK
jgi:hypothetical protein